MSLVKNITWEKRERGSEYHVCGEEYQVVQRGREYHVCCEEEYQVVKRGREYHGCGEEYNMNKNGKGKQYHLPYNIEAVWEIWEKKIKIYQQLGWGTLYTPAVKSNNANTI